MNLNKKLFLLFIFSGLLLISIKYFPFHCNSNFCTANFSSNLKTGTVKIGDKEIKVEIADTEALRERGLSGRRSLKEGTGMLFVFDTPEKYGFWMKDMKFSIDMLWFDEKSLIWMERAVSPETYPQVLYPHSPAKYVLEVPAGFSAKENINMSDSFSVSY